MKKFNYIDLFAGAGGLSEGFVKAGFNPIAHVEMDEAACYTLKTRSAYHYLSSHNQFETYLSYLKGEINRERLYSVIPAAELDKIINLPIGKGSNQQIFSKIDKNLNGDTIDLIIGGPPCQAYSLVGRARSKDNMKNDPRNYLYIQYGEYLERYSPKLFLFENVMGLLSANKGIHLKNMEQLFMEKGYTIKIFVVVANKFGVLQTRKRIIIVGWKTDLKITIPNLEQIEIKKGIYRVRDLFDDLPNLNAGEGKDKYSSYTNELSGYLEHFRIRTGFDVLTQHIARPHNEQDKEIYRIVVGKWDEAQQRLNYNDLPEVLKTHNNRKSFIDRFKVVAPELPCSHTVVAHIAKDGHHYIHPDMNQNRSLTVREAARLQSFPDSYYFEGISEGMNRTAAFKQIGNAVPPLMSEAIAVNIKDVLQTMG